MHWRPFHRHRSGLLVCPSCRSAFVVPVACHAADGGRWWMRLRCGECERARELTVPVELARRYERELGKSVRALRATLRSDPIGASDFAPDRS